MHRFQILLNDRDQQVGLFIVDVLSPIALFLF